MFIKMEKNHVIISVHAEEILVCKIVEVCGHVELNYSES